MKSKYKSYTGHEYNGFGELGKNLLIDLFKDFGKSQKDYVDGYYALTALYGAAPVKVVPQNYGMKGIGRAMSDKRESGILTMLETGGAEALNTTLVVDYGLDKISDSHEMLAYISWIDANPKLK